MGLGRMVVIIMVLVLAARCSSVGGSGHSGDDGMVTAVAEPLMGTVRMPALPSSFPIIEFTDYGIQGHLMPPKDPRPNHHLAKGRQGQPYQPPSQQVHAKNTFLAGSVPINAYHNPTTDLLSRYPNSPSPNPSWSSPGVTGGLPGKEMDLRMLGTSDKDARLGDYGGASTHRLDYTQYFAENDEAKQGTLEAALHTLWTHRTDAYNTMEETGSAAINHAWLDVLNTHHPYTTTHTEVTHKYSPPGSPTKELSYYHHNEGPIRGVGSTPRPGSYNPGKKIKSGHLQHPLLMDSHRTHPTHYRNGGGRRTHPVVAQQPKRIRGKPVDHVGIVMPPAGNGRVQPASRPGVGPKRIGVIHPPGRSTRIGLKALHRHQQPYLKRPRGSQTSVQMVRRRLPVGQVGIAAPGDNPFSTAYLTPNSQHPEAPLVDYNSPDFSNYVKYQDYVNIGQTSSVNPSLLGPIAPVTQLGQQNLKPNAETGLTFAEAVELANLLGDPLQKKLLLDSDFRNSAVGMLQKQHQQGGSGWMYEMGHMMSEVSKQLPRIDKAVTTMSFLAFGIFMANLVVQAIANSSINSLLGREDLSGFNALPLDFSSFQLDFGRFDLNLGLENDNLDQDNGMLTKVADVISQVYFSLHEMARAGVINMVSALGLSIPKTRTSPEIADLEPECLQRLLCEGHHATLPYFQDTVPYRLLPFWTMGVSWLSGVSSIPRLLEELRAEIAGQRGLDCFSLFPECMDTMIVDKLLLQIESELVDTKGGITVGPAVETSQDMAVGDIRYSNTESMSDGTDTNFDKDGNIDLAPRLITHRDEYMGMV
ncbi:uncharacterized protein LOC121860428 [Homarus americanus]|uniref:Uncharacterized protein n=1 Tax=Homarus americanus TaxID=6706 RepID=A0A8J5N6J1_HOMAM|nr:uncharacterized protein LOC121860428 [Homarus americanus]KAG7173543.1 hypothetical protein Hamer_G020173 [Homarus americanus]